MMECISISSPEAPSGEVSPDLQENDTVVSVKSTGSASSSKSGGSRERILTSIRKHALIRKTPHRRSVSPQNWFPRKKTESFLKRKIRRLQEVGGMNSTLDETLGDTNLHYTRLTREKIAAREAVKEAMETRKAAMVEASWCRILRAASIQSDQAEAELEKSEKLAAEAFDAATAMGVMMYDHPDYPRRSCEINKPSDMEEGSIHAVTASFETTFDVDKEVAAAVKEAFVRLGNFSELDCVHLSPSFSGERNTPFSDIVTKMLERIRGLQKEQLCSLSTIVATCGLNAALLKLDNGKGYDNGFQPLGDLDSQKRKSIMPTATGSRRFSSRSWLPKKKETASEIPGLDKFLVKHVSKLEREVATARNSKRDGSSLENQESRTDEDGKEEQWPSSPPGLDQVLVKHFSKLETEVLEAKNSAKTSDVRQAITEQSKARANDSDMPSLDKLMVKHVSRLEREILEARKLNKETEFNRVKQRGSKDENCNVGLAEILSKKHQPELENAKIAAAKLPPLDRESKTSVTRREARERELHEVWGGLSLGNSMKPHISRLERDKAAWRRAEENEGRRRRSVDL